MTKTTLAVLALAMLPTVAPAQSKQQPTWNDLLKPYEAKTNPAIPIAPPAPPPLSWVDECVTNTVFRHALPLPVEFWQLRRIQRWCDKQFEEIVASSESIRKLLQK